MDSDASRTRDRRPRFTQRLALIVSILLLLGVAMALAPGDASGQRQSTAGPSLSAANLQSPAAAQPVISWEHDQIEPEVAYGSGPNQYLVVWEDHHWASGDARDILGRRINTSGTGVGGAFNISWEGNERFAPDVAYNSVRQNYLVVFEYEFSLTDHDIYGRFVNSDGTLGSEFAIATPGAYDQNPVVAYSSALDSYLVVWERRIGDPEFGQTDIYARVVNYDGSLPGSEIALDTGSANQEHPAIAYNSSSWDEYLVVWQDRQAGNWDIMGRRVDSDGDLLGGEITIEAPGHDQTWPDIAYNSRRAEYLVVWEDQIGGATSDWDIKAWRRNIAGSAVSSYLISSAGTQRRMKPAVTYKYAADEYLVVYEYEYSASDLDLKQSRLRWDGVARQTDAIVSNAYNIHEARPAVVSDGSWSNLVVWEDWRNAGSMAIDIYGDVVPVYGFEGLVYEGLPLDTSTPLVGVDLALFCHTSPDDWGTYVEGTTTDSAGAYTLVVHDPCAYYNIGEYTPTGYESTGASSIGGAVKTWDWIQYSGSLGSQTLTGNNFWDAPQAPAAPTGVSASDGTYTDRVRVTWSSSSGATYYQVYRATSAGGTRTLLGSPTGTSYDDTTATVGTTYYYWVTACNSWGCSDYSSYDTGYRSGTPPSPPTGVAATDGTYTDRVRVTWSAASGATYYQVYHAASETGGRALIGSPAGSPFDDTSAPESTTYYYWVVACNTWGCSGYSAHDTGYRSLPPPGMVSWRSTRNRTSSSFGEFFDDAEADGFMIVDIEVDEIDGVERVSGVFQKNLDGRGWAELRNMNSTQFQNMMADMIAQDYRLVDQEVYTLSGSTYYAGIWIQNIESFEWESYVDVTDADFSTLFDTYSNLGYLIIDVDAYHIGGNLRFSGVWVENREGLDWLEFRNLTSEEFSQKFALYQDAYRMIDVESYRVGENQYYACIWVENANGRRWAELRDMSSKVFHEKWMELRDAGYRLVEQEIYPTADGWRYAGIWRQNGDRPDWTLKGNVDTLLQTHFDQHNIPGMSVAIAENGKFLYLRGFGYADVPNHVDANSRTIYRLASVSKAVAGVLGMVLSDQNLLDLTRASSFYIPNLPAHHTHTVSQTLSNRSGIGHYKDNDTYGTISGHYATALDAAKELWDEPLVYTPGMGYKYSTHAYTFAGASMEGATGKPIASILNDYLAAPYNLSTLRVEDRGAANPNRSLLYSLIYSDTLEVTPDDLSWKVLGGGLESSAYDLARFGIKLLDGSILPPGALAAMWTPPDTSQCNEMGAVGVYALGWCTGTHSGTRAVFKSGVQNGAKSYILVYPDEGIVIAVLTNSRYGDHDPVWLAKEIGKLMLAQGSISASQYDQNQLVVTQTDPVEEPDDEGLDPADVVWPVSNPTVDPDPADLEEPGDEPIVETRLFLPLIIR